jgi:glycosyltransferase involved in cell wall biosynthesis
MMPQKKENFLLDFKTNLPEESKIKILYLVHQFYPYYFSGTEKFVYHMATCMQKQGHQVKVVTFAFKENLGNSKKEGNLLTERYMYNGIPVISFGYEKIRADVHYQVDNQEMKRFTEKLLSEEKPDVIHAGHLMRVFDILKSAKMKSIPYIVTLTDFWALCFRGILVDSNLDLCTGPKETEKCVRRCPHLPQEIIDFRLKETRELLKGAKAVCSPTNFLANIYMNAIPALNIKVIELGLKIGKVINNQKRMEKGDPVTFMFGGTWLPHKGLSVLLKAFGKVKSDKAVLNIYGAGPDAAYNDLVINSAKKDKRIQIKGVFCEEDLPMIFRESDCSVVPSIWWENSPYMMKEALAYNVPVIATNVNGLTEYVKDGFNGFTFRLGDSWHLREVMERIVNDPQLLNMMKGNLAKYIMPTVEEEAYAYEKLYISRM